MADIGETRKGLETLRGLLNRERFEEIAEGAGMRKAFRNAESAIADYEKAKSGLRFAEAVPLSEAAAAAVEAAWAHYRRLEDGWNFDQVAKLDTSLAALANEKRHPHFGVRRFFYTDLRQAFQAANDKLAFIKAWLPESGESGVRRGHVWDAWDATNASWNAEAAIERRGGLPGSWLFRGTVLAVVNAEAVKRTKLANDASLAEYEAAKAAVADGQPEPAKPAKVRPAELTWEAVVKDETAFLAALPQDEVAAATRERLTAQRSLAMKLDAKGLKVEGLWDAFKAGKLVANGVTNGKNGAAAGLTDAEVALIAARFEAMEVPKVPKGTPAPSAEALAAPTATSAAADTSDWPACPNKGQPGCQGQRRPDRDLCARCAQKARKSAAPTPAAPPTLDVSGDGRSAPAPEGEAMEVGLDDPKFKGFIVAEAEKAGQSGQQVLAKLAAEPAALTAARVAYAASLVSGNGKDKPESPKRKAKADGKAKAEAKNDNPAPRRGLLGRKRVPATAEAE